MRREMTPLASSQSSGSSNQITELTTMGFTGRSMWSQAASAAGIVEELMASRYGLGTAPPSGRSRAPQVADY